MDSKYDYKDREFKKLCKKRMREAIKNKDGYLAHFYGRLLGYSIELRNPLIKKGTQIFID